MSSSIDKLAKDLYSIIDKKQEKKPSGYSTTATVSKIDDQTMWVRFPGNDFDTPVSNTVEASPGDTVQVQVSNGRALATGNASAPSTDNTRANQAYNVGTEAGEIAEAAIQNASRAQRAADAATAYAGEAQRKAGEAEIAAEEASDAANKSTFMLSEIEKIVDVLTWIGEHGTYKLSNDTEVIGGKLYFTLTGQAITNPTGNPSTSRYYELNSNNQYVLSTDTSVVSGKTYYTVTGSPANPSSSPKDEGLYELNEIDSAVSSYISSHLILDDDGLKLTMAKNRSSYLLLSPSGGMIIYRNGRPISEYGERTVLGDIEGYHIEITGGANSELGFYSGQGEDYKVAYINGNQLYIPQVVVVTSMQVGDADNGIGAWRWSLNEIGTMGLYWIGGINNG